MLPIRAETNLAGEVRSGCWPPKPRSQLTAAIAGAKSVWTSRSYARTKGGPQARKIDQTSARETRTCGKLDVQSRHLHAAV